MQEGQKWKAVEILWAYCWYIACQTLHKWPVSDLISTNYGDNNLGKLVWINSIGNLSKSSKKNTIGNIFALARGSSEVYLGALFKSIMFLVNFA